MYMVLKIDNKSLVLEDNNVISFFKGNITKIGNGAKINCKKEFLDKGYTCWVVVVKTE